MATIRKRGNTWQVQIRRRGNSPTSASFATRADAVAWARKSERDADLGELPERLDNVTSLADILRRYQVEITPPKKGREAENRRINRLLKDDISKRKIRELKPEDLAKFRQSRLKAGPGAARHDLIIIRHAISIGMKEWGLPMKVNPCRDIALPPPSKPRKRRLTDQEYQSVLASADRGLSHWMRPLIEFATETAMRRSELLKLRWSDIDPELRLAKLEDTKNGESRHVPLSRQAIVVLASLPRIEERVFPITDNSVRLAWPRLLRRAGLTDLRFHDLRHEAISRFFERGLSMPEVALISGHKTPAMLFRYTHLRPEAVAEKLS